jgi:hypothetical protein
MFKLVFVKTETTIIIIYYKQNLITNANNISVTNIISLASQ